MIEVLKPGLQTTVQDSGRPGHLGQGIPPAGPQDHYSFKAASLLVGNDPPLPPLSLGDPGQAGLEATIIGPTLRFTEPALIAVTGADADARLDGEPLPLWTAVAVAAESVLEMGMARRGVRGYLAVAGGIDVPLDLGSRSTYLVGARGGHHGRALKTGDRLPIGEPVGKVTPGLALAPELRLGFDRRPEELRVVMGPQDFRFSASGIETFLGCEFALSAKANRMGFRFEGRSLDLEPRPDYLVRDAGSGAADIVDDVSPLGAVQVPAGSEIIVLGVEVPSAGGYAKIATMISADLSRLGQLRPGETVRFRAVELAEAHAIGRERDGDLDGDVLVVAGG
jgi:biotin-dependent carboxylase-like uncharacterized protein